MLRQSKTITSLLSSYERYHDAFSGILKTAEALRLDRQFPAAAITGQSFLSTQAVSLS